MRARPESQASVSSLKKKGNKECNDENNNAGCDWDGGDCCGPSNYKPFCKKCECLDCTYVPPTTPKPKCQDEKYKGDGHCDDHNNNKGCDYDGGDCCGPKVVKTFCTKCKCKDPNYTPGSTTTPKPTTTKLTTTTTRRACRYPNFKGDTNY